MRGVGKAHRLLSVGFLALMSAPAHAADVVPSRTADRTAVRLSESVHVTLAVEGPTLLRVELPAELLDEQSAPAWRLRPAGPAKTEDLPGGKQRWSQPYRADPYQPGEKLRLGFAAARAFAGANPQPQPVEWPAVEVTVTTEVTGDLAEVRPPTGIEALPAPPSQPVPAWGWVVGTVGLAVAALAAGLLVRRAVRRAATPLPPREWATRELDRLAAEPHEGAAFAERLSAVVRRSIELRSPLSATKLTTAELVARLGPEGGWPAEVLADVTAVLDRCDVSKFAPAPAAADREALLTAARRIVTWSEPEA